MVVAAPLFPRHEQSDGDRRDQGGVDTEADIINQPADASPSSPSTVADRLVEWRRAARRSQRACSNTGIARFALAGQSDGADTVACAWRLRERATPYPALHYCRDRGRSLVNCCPPMYGRESTRRPITRPPSSPLLVVQSATDCAATRPQSSTGCSIRAIPESDKWFLTLCERLSPSALHRSTAVTTFGDFHVSSREVTTTFFTRRVRLHREHPGAAINGTRSTPGRGRTMLEQSDRAASPHLPLLQAALASRRCIEPVARSRCIYLDHAATTLMLPSAFGGDAAVPRTELACQPLLAACQGRAARRAIDGARDALADFVGLCAGRAGLHFRWN